MNHEPKNPPINSRLWKSHTAVAINRGSRKSMLCSCWSKDNLLMMVGFAEYLLAHISSTNNSGNLDGNTRRTHKPTKFIARAASNTQLFFKKHKNKQT